MAAIPIDVGARTRGSFRAEEIEKVIARAVSDALTSYAEAIARCSSSPRSGITFAAWVGQVLDARVALGYKATADARSIVRIHVEDDPLGRLPIEAVDRAAVSAWLARMQTKTRRRGLDARPLAVSTIKNALNVVRGALQQAEDAGHIAQNPAAGKRVAAVLGRTRPRRPWTVLVPEEVERLLRAARGDLRHRIAILVGSGLRLEELQLLEVQDVEIDGDAPHLIVRWGSIYEGVKRSPKNGKARKVPLFGVALAALRAWMKLRGDVRADAYLFPGRNGVGKRHQSGGVKGWRRALVAARIDARAGLTWHALRHTCATALLGGWWFEPWPLQRVQKLLDHANASTTERYAHLLDRDLFDAVRELAYSGPAIDVNGDRDARRARLSALFDSHPRLVKTALPRRSSAARDARSRRC